MKKILCQNNKYFCSSNRRKLSSVLGVVIHYTGGENDSAVNNANYFKHNHGKYAGAHIVIDYGGHIVKCAPYTVCCYSVGQDMRSGEKGEAHFLGKLRNDNTVSIELAGIAKRDPSVKQINACVKVLKNIRRHCKNAKIVCRHWDVNGKDCPARMTGKDNKRWKAFCRKLKVNIRNKKFTFYGGE